MIKDWITYSVTFFVSFVVSYFYTKELNEKK